VKFVIMDETVMHRFQTKKWPLFSRCPGGTRSCTTVLCRPFIRSRLEEVIESPNTSMNQGLIF